MDEDHRDIYQREDAQASEQYIELLRKKPSYTGVRKVDAILKLYPELGDIPNGIWGRILLINHRVFDRQKEIIEAAEIDPEIKRKSIQFLNGIQQIRHDFYLNRLNEYYAQRKKVDSNIELLTVSLEQFDTLCVYFDVHYAAHRSGISKRILMSCDNGIEKLDAKIADLRAHTFVSKEVTAIAIETLEDAKKALKDILEKRIVAETLKPKREPRGKREPNPSVRIPQTTIAVRIPQTTIARHIAAHPGVKVDALIEALTALKGWKTQHNFPDGLKRHGFKGLAVGDLLTTEKPEIVVMHEVCRLRTEMDKHGMHDDPDFEQIVDSLFDALIKAFYPDQNETKLALSKQYEQAVNELTLFFNANREDGRRMVLNSSDRTTIAAAKADLFEIPKSLPWITMSPEDFEGRLKWLGDKARAALVISSGRTYDRSGDDRLVNENTASQWIGLIFQLRTAHRLVNQHIIGASTEVSR